LKAIIPLVVSPFCEIDTDVNKWLSHGMPLPAPGGEENQELNNLNSILSRSAVTPVFPRKKKEFLHRHKSLYANSIP